MIRGDDKHRVLGGARAIEKRPPIHRWRCAPRIHICTHAHCDFGTIECKLANRFWKEPVITNRTTNVSDFSLRNWKHRRWIRTNIMRRSVHFPRNPRIHFAIDAANAARTTENRRVIDNVIPVGRRFDECSSLDKNAQLLTEFQVLVDVFVRYGNREVLSKFGDRGIDRCSVREFGKSEKSHIEEWLVSRVGLFDHLAHSIDASADLAAVARAIKGGLNCSGVVSHVWKFNRVFFCATRKPSSAVAILD